MQYIVLYDPATFSSKVWQRVATGNSNYVAAVVVTAANRCCTC